MHKIMKILTIVVVAIIVLILVFTVGKAAGVFKSFGGITTQDEEDKSGRSQYRMSVVCLKRMQRHC